LEDFVAALGCKTKRDIFAVVEKHSQGNCKSKGSGGKANY